VGAVQASWIGDRLKQVGAPDRASNGNRLRRVHRSTKLATFENAYFKAHSLLGPLLAWPWVGIDEVKVAGRHPDAVEPKHVQHPGPLARRIHTLRRTGLRVRSSLISVSRCSALTSSKIRHTMSSASSASNVVGG
jgi:hypothetical protein